MFEIATLAKDKTLQLPPEIAKQFLPFDRFIIWLDGDVLHLKRLEPSPLQVVEQAPDEEQMPMEEINEIVHEVRRQRYKRKIQ